MEFSKLIYCGRVECFLLSFSSRGGECKTARLNCGLQRQTSKRRTCRKESLNVICIIQTFRIKRHASDSSLRVDMLFDLWSFSTFCCCQFLLELLKVYFQSTEVICAYKYTLCFHLPVSHNIPPISQHPSLIHIDVCEVMNRNE